MAERYFENAGKELLSIRNAIAKNQKIARLLKYSDGDPLSADKPNIDGFSLAGKNITLVPYMDDDEELTESVIMILFDRFWQNRANKDFKLLRIRFNIICPMRSWVMDNGILRPFLIMSEIDKIMNKSRLAGLGTVEFDSADRLVVSQFSSGYVVDYVCDSFN